MKKIMLALVLAVCAVNAKTIMLYIDLDKVLDSAEFAEIVGNEVRFSFGSGSKENIYAGGAKTRASLSKGTETNHFNKSLSGKKYALNEVESTCGFALLLNLADLRDDALKIGATKAVNIISYYTSSTALDSKDKFQCIVSNSSIRVKLKADFAK